MTTRGRVFQIGGLILVGLLLAIPVGWVFVGMQTADGMGSMTEAVKLRPGVEAISDPSQIPRSDRVYIVKGFPNGEWVFGVAEDSHAWFSRYNGGGTVVLKDSRGRVRCFFGHVCGDGGLMLANQPTSLDEFDAAMVAGHYTEQPWP